MPSSSTINISLFSSSLSQGLFMGIILELDQREDLIKGINSIDIVICST
jgi:hypothetical protein